jgi:hypothetical protein
MSLHRFAKNGDLDNSAEALAGEFVSIAADMPQSWS